MPKNKKTSSTAKAGINNVRSVVEAANSLFHKIDQENDLGIDAIIELIRNETPTHKQLAIQIKSGESYYDRKSDSCLLPVGNHLDYWAKHPLPVYGVVYVPSLLLSSWVDIKYFLKCNPNARTIKFKRSRANIFNLASFEKIFIPMFLNEVPDLAFEESASFLESPDEFESFIGMMVLFRKFPNRLETWNLLIQALKKKNTSQISPKLIYYLAHIPWHPDIWYRGEAFTNATREYAQNCFSKFTMADITKLLSFVGEEGISRGTIGQSVESIISSLPNRRLLLEDVIANQTVSMHSREVAALIYAYCEKQNSIPVLTKLANEESWYAQELVRILHESGWIDLYM